MRTVTLYTKAGCHLCDQARVALERMRREIAFETLECDICAEEALHRAYFDRVPVIALDGAELCDCVLDEEALREALASRRR